MAWTLRLSAEPAASVGEPVVVEVRIDEDGAERLLRRVRLDVVPSPRDMAQLRWYFEDFPNHPYDPAPTLGDAARERMSQLGCAMFASLRAAVADPLLDQRLGDKLDETNIEVRGSAGSLPWEMLREPDSGRLPAISARRMVRLAAGSHGALTTHLSGRPRMLLVVSRPAGARDVRFQSVARPLVSTLDQHGRLDLTVLRPPTYPALLNVLSSARAAGQPFELVHFDGHGLITRARGTSCSKAIVRGSAACGSQARGSGVTSRRRASA